MRSENESRETSNFDSALIRVKLITLKLKFNHKCRVIYQFHLTNMDELAGWVGPARLVYVLVSELRPLLPILLPQNKCFPRSSGEHRNVLIPTSQLHSVWPVLKAVILMYVLVSQALRGEETKGFRMMYYGPYSDILSTFTLFKQIAQIPQNLLLARVKTGFSPITNINKEVIFHKMVFESRNLGPSASNSACGSTENMPHRAGCDLRLRSRVASTTPKTCFCVQYRHCELRI